MVVLGVVGFRVVEVVESFFGFKTSIRVVHRKLPSPQVVVKGAVIDSIVVVIISVAAELGVVLVVLAGFLVFLRASRSAGFLIRTQVMRIGIG